MHESEKKLLELRKYLRQKGPLIIAYSGGIDSALLLKVAYDELASQVLAVTADSPSIPRKELEEAIALARDIGARHEVISTAEIENQEYVLNPNNRCYYCKTELYTKLKEIARRENIHTLANGTNLDDLGDYRPGLQAAQEFQVISPLKEMSISKKEVRGLARSLKIKIWDKPATPCLASRVPYGSLVTAEKLSRIEGAEDFLKKLDINELRVRHFGEKARIEIHPADFHKIASNRLQIEKEFVLFGFKEIEVIEFQSGALNKVI